MRDIFVLLVVFQLKHFLADYPLQGKYMVLGKAQPGWKFMTPLAAHTGVHAIFTWVIASIWLGPGWHHGLPEFLAVFDFDTHFVMDRIKAGPRYLGRFNDTTKPYFWWCLGFDQMVHHLVQIIIIFLLMRA